MIQASLDRLLPPLTMGGGILKYTTESECAKQFGMGANRALYSDYKDNFALAELEIRLSWLIAFRL